MYHPRGKNKVANPSNLSAMYQEYIADKEEDSPYYVDQKTFIAINDLYWREAVDNVLAGKLMEMPFKTGRIFIEKKKAPNFRTSNRFIDWKTTNEIGKLTYHLNEHSNGFNYFIRWIKQGNIKNSIKYRFIPTRDFRRTLAKIIKSKQLDYFER